MGDRYAPDLSVHATAVAIGRRALVLFGASRSGKSTLAAGLIACSGLRCRIRLVGDDRVRIARHDDRVEVRPHPRIAGFIERRGFGFVAVAWCERATVAGVATLDEGAVPDWCGNLPVLPLVTIDEARRCTAVLEWWPTVARV